MFWLSDSNSDNEHECFALFVSIFYAQNLQNEVMKMICFRDAEDFSWGWSIKTNFLATCQARQLIYSKNKNIGLSETVRRC